ncbi:MAG: bifunctional hydroxymethylpyrimidine kinase/phosphomethylpyrimidine kinase [Terriglobia bacterium]|nr:MAG: bifunctional hydroxymethylpyrimidine kinase/phosphomethylpyrimidine kinase [Terriglobia bacterium]
MRVALTIAGSDPSGGAGIQADLKTFHQFGVYGEAVITLITVQNTQRVSRVQTLSADLVMEQLEAVLEDIPPDAAKTGALGSMEVVRCLARAAATYEFPLVVDPVLISTQGRRLLAPEAVDVLRTELFPRAALVTPNLPEAELLSGIAIRGTEELYRAAETIRAHGAGAVLIKGGHREGSATDVLLDDEGWHEFPAPRIETVHTHGTGCTYSAAITAGLACGLPLRDAISRAKEFIHAAIAAAPKLGRGCGPLNHHAGDTP